MRTVLVVAVWLAWAAGSVWLLRVVVRDRAEAESWRHRAATAETALDALVGQVGCWRCSCGHIITSRTPPHYLAGGIVHGQDRCRPLDDVDAP